MKNNKTKLISRDKHGNDNLQIDDRRIERVH